MDKDVAVSKGKTTLNIQLKEDTQALDEVVVVGYGSVKKRDLTGSVSQISSSSIQNQAVMKDPMQALQGKIAGADITMGNSPGASSAIVIRGYNSINAGNDPLIVVDDAPFGGKIDEINPAEIESIDVLKDASSMVLEEQMVLLSLRQNVPVRKLNCLLVMTDMSVCPSHLKIMI